LLDKAEKLGSKKLNLMWIITGCFVWWREVFNENYQLLVLVQSQMTFKV